MSLEIIKRDSELLLDITKKYLILLKYKGMRSRKSKFEAYITSLLINIERNINENVKEPNKTISESS